MAKEPKVVDDPRGRGKMLIPSPLSVEALIREVPKGKLATVAQIRERLARDSQADLTCPLTTGIFLRMVAEAAEEDLANGKKDITPYWRVIKEDGGLNEKSGSLEAQAARLREEGFHILPGKRAPRVLGFAEALHKLCPRLMRH